jgi:hypothetical protein
MMRSLVLLALLSASSAALAQGRPVENVAPGNAGSQPAGGLSAHDVSGKRLLDANGVPIGQIESATGDTATVRTTDGRHIKVSMDKLSLGNGPHTAIEDSNSDADKLNQTAVGNVK